VVALAIAWLVLRPVSYVARAPVLVDVRNDPVDATPWQGMISPGYIATQIDIVKSQSVAERVVELLPADQEPMLRYGQRARAEGQPRAWIADALLRRLEVKPARESNIITIAWTGRSPAEAARVANAFAQAYLDTNLNLKNAPAKRYTEWFDQQVAQARERLESAQARLADFQQKAGLVSSTEQGDYERQRLAELTAQLIAARVRLSEGAGSSSPELAQSPVVNSLRSDVARLESKVQEASASMGANHPKMREMQAELGAMRSRLAAESSRAGQTVAASAAASAARIRQLENEIAQQKARVLASSRERGELSVLQQEVASAQKAYETVAGGAAQSRLQSMTTQGNVLFLGAATEPLRPAGPPPMLVVGAALVGGLLLGLAGALLTELVNRRVRSVEDLESVTHLPILGVVPAPSSRSLALRFNDGPRRLGLNPQRRLA
jgi:polysaccharide biosynthesis transport protein